MPDPQMIDYAALADQARKQATASGGRGGGPGITGGPPPVGGPIAAAAVDYAALADQVRQQHALPPDRRKAPASPPPSVESFTRPLTLLERVGRSPLGDVAEQFDYRTPTGRRNLAGAGGALALTAAAGPAGLALGSGLVSAGPAATVGALTASEALGAGVVGAGTAGALAETVEQLVGTRPPTSRGAVLAGVEQAALETAGHIIPWGVKALGRRVVAFGVSRRAATALQGLRTATTERLANALETAQDAAGDVKEAARRTLSYTRGDVADRLRTARGEAAAGVKAATTVGAEGTAAAKATAEHGVEAAHGQGALDILRATDQATATRTAAERPFSALIGQPPSAASAGRAADAIIRGPAQEARDLAGQAVDRAAKAGPLIDLKPLKARAQAVVDQIAKPETSFPRVPPDNAIVTQLEAQTGKKLADLQADPRYATLLEQAGLGPSALQVAQAEATRDTLKHPAMQILNRILNAADQVPFYDAHLWKSELQNALASTYDKAQKKQVTSLTEHVAAGLRQALAVHEPYNAATAKYASIVPLYTKEYAAAFRRQAATDPDALVRMIKPGKSGPLRMLRDLLVNQSAEVGKGEAGQAAWDSVRGAWTHTNLFNKGIEGLDTQLARLPKDFSDIFFGDAHGQQVLQNLQQISSAYKAATAAGEAGIGAAKASASSGVEAATSTGARDVEAARSAATQGIEAARSAGRTTIEQTRRVGESAVEQAERASAGVRRQAAVDIRTARRAKTTFDKTPTAEETRFASSSLAGHHPSPEELAAHGIRALGLGPFQLWGALSWMKLLTGPQEKDLLEWAAYSPANTQRLVRFFTGPSPTGTVVADFLRGAGVLTGVLTPKDDRSRIGQPPPIRR